MNKLPEITRKVLSYCEIPEELTEHHWLQEMSCDCYIAYSVSKDDFDDDLEKWIKDNYPEVIGETIFIHMDY